MTNREYMVMQLTDPDCIDDGGASYESMVFYNVECPYYVGDERCLCAGKIPRRDLCYLCKEEWLDNEVDE
ncbi:hypothetical protein D1155_10055 [Anaerotruncus sp. 80]|uniref:Uncharacterized protein n=1 Tax=Anaerotruncus colihominis TaxID=169435 RepID=A0A845QIJ7_9FIRM|nr:hypothetical protein [Anaerotruncus colihominis]NCF02647.1 hypothetical protein [Anaerotruncus sp. 80]